MDAHVLTLMIWIGSVTGYNTPSVAPKVSYVTENEISILYCGKVLEKCKIGGLYWWGTNRVYVNKDQTSDGREAVLVHELTHYLQNRNHAFAKGDCLDKMNRELQSYAVEKQYSLIHFPNVGRKIRVPPEINLNLCPKNK